MSRLVEQLDKACQGCSSDDRALAYVWMGSFVRHLTRAHVEGRHDEVRAVFDLIEAEIAGKGPEEELAVIGFLEDLQNGSLHQSGTTPAEFRAYLGPHTLAAWEQLNGFWEMAGGKSPPSS